MSTTDKNTQRRYRPEDFQHETDKALIDELLRSSAAETLKGFLLENKIEDAYTYYHASSCREISRQGPPGIMEMLAEAGEMFGLERLPHVYLTWEYKDGVSVGGVSDPFIVISTDFLSRLDERQLRGTLAAQCGAIAAGHGEMNYLLWLVQYLMGLVPVQILPGFVKEAVSGLLAGGLNKWAQFRVYTTDRAFLVATRDYELAVNQIFIQCMSRAQRERFALGTEKDRYLEQMEAFFQDTGVSNVVQTVSSFTRDDAWLPKRYDELRRFREERGIL